MRVLLDAQAFLWFGADNPNLSSKAKLQIELATNDKLISVATPWEIAI